VPVLIPLRAGLNPENGKSRKYPKTLDAGLRRHDGSEARDHFSNLSHHKPCITPGYAEFLIIPVHPEPATTYPFILSLSKDETGDSCVTLLTGIPEK
jgi:hypothetical protein